MSDTIERSMFPWLRDSGQGDRRSERLKARMRAVNERLTGSIKDRAHLYFRTDMNDTQARANMACPEIDEYEVMQVMWDKFGIPATDLERLDAKWVSNILTIISEDNQAQNERMKRQP